MESLIILCSNCGQRNRIGEVTPGRIWNCATCQSKLLTGSEYAEATCPECGTDFTAIVPASLQCPSCEYVFEVDEEGLWLGHDSDDRNDTSEYDEDHADPSAASSFFAPVRGLDEEMAIPFEGYAPLLEIADQELYRRNAFRILVVDIERTDREIEKELEQRRMMQKLGRSGPELKGVFSIHPPPDMDALRAAEQRLRDLEQRFLHELFWFWPLSPGGARTDIGLLAVARGDVQYASRYWIENQSDPSTASVCNHNLAVLSHLTALDLECSAERTRLSPEDDTLLEFHWEQALNRWANAIDDDNFWKRIRAKVTARDNSGMSLEIADRIRESLPVALLSINAFMAARLAEKDRLDQAHLEVNRIQTSRFDEKAIDEALRRAAMPIHERVKAICKKAREASNEHPAEVERIAGTLLRDLDDSLNALSCLLEDSGALADAANDEVALVLVECARIHRDHTRNWKECFGLLEEASLRARSESLQARIDKDSATTRSLRLSFYLDPLFEDINKIAESDLAPAEKLLKLSDEIPPKIWKLGEVQDEELVRVAGNLLAGAFRGVSIDLHNETEDYEKSLEALELAVTYCTDEALIGRIREDEALVQKHHKQSRIFDELKPINSAPGLRTVNGIGTTLYGRSDYDEETRSYLTTLYFVVLFLPVLPIARYRVIQEQSGYYRFLGKAPLRRFDKFHMALVPIILAGIVIGVMLDESSRSANTASSGPSVGGRQTSSAPPSAATNKSVTSPNKLGLSATSSSSAEKTRLRLQIEAAKKKLTQLEGEIGRLQQQSNYYQTQLESLDPAIKGMPRDPVSGAVVVRSEYESEIIDQHNDYVRRYKSAQKDLMAKQEKRDKLEVDLKTLQERYESFSIVQ
jgi:hypothetical protein